MKRFWWMTLEERQRKFREMRGKEPAEPRPREPKKRNPYRRGAKAYLASFNVGDIREYNEPYNWDTLRSIASKMKSDFGCIFVFHNSKQERFITRVR